MPSITEKNDVIYASVNTAIILNVSFFSNDGATPTAKWFKIVNETKLAIWKTDEGFQYGTTQHDVEVLYHTVKIIQTGYLTQLFIDSINTDDFVEYAVEITNSIGNVYHNTMLKARGKLSNY